MPIPASPILGPSIDESRIANDVLVLQLDGTQLEALSIAALGHDVSPSDECSLEFLEAG